MIVMMMIAAAAAAAGAMGQITKVDVTVPKVPSHFLRFSLLVLLRCCGYFQPKGRSGHLALSCTPFPPAQPLNHGHVLLNLLFVPCPLTLMHGSEKRKGPWVMKLLLLYDNALASLCIHYWLFVYLSCPSFVPVSIYNFSFCTIIAPFLHSSLFFFRCHLSTLSTFSASSSFHYLSFCFPFRLCSIPFLYSFSLVLQIQNVNFNIGIISFVFLTSSQPSNFSLPFLSFS